MRARRSMAALAFVLTGCSAILGIEDYHSAGGVDDGGSVDGGTTTDGSEPDAATPACEGNDFQDDARNCGRCGHDCAGGACNAGHCLAVDLGGAIAGVSEVTLSAEYVYATSYNYTGVWRVKKNGSAAAEHVITDVTVSYVGVAEVGTTLWVTKWNTVGAGGGLYRCDLTALPCTPTLARAAHYPQAIVPFGGKLYYGDQSSGAGVMEFDPADLSGTIRVVYPDFPMPTLHLTGGRAFYATTFTGDPRYARILEMFTDGGFRKVNEYSSEGAETSSLSGLGNDLLLAAYDLDPGSGGTVRRVSPGGQTLCEYGKDGGILRPLGAVADEKNVYWSNGGDGPYNGTWVGGSVVSCAHDTTTCCQTPEVLWKGDRAPHGMAADDKALYWVTREDGAFHKVAKP